MMYDLRTDVINDEDNNEFTVYGIDIKCSDSILKSYCDIFFDINKAKDFVEFCRRNKPTPELMEILIQNIFE